MSNNNNSNNNRRNSNRNINRRAPPRPFPFNTQPLANDPIWREYGYNMPNENDFQLAQSYPATPNRGTLEYTVPPSPPRLVRSTGFPRSRSASINSTASNNSTGTTNPAPVLFANQLAAIPENNNESVNMLRENENGEFSNTNEEYSNINSNYNSNNENPKPLRKKVKLTTNGNAHGGKRSAKRSAKRRSAKRRSAKRRSAKRRTHRAPRK
jgi:hypothetical protein